jgi:hypothetical protein
MTGARQQRKLVWAGLTLGLTLFATVSASEPLFAAPDEPLAVDDRTGLALSGFDPVAYFANARARVGRPEVELRFDGTVWHFLNEGNRAAFAEHPEVYTPRFGGYDPVAIARGASVPGHPLYWLVSGERLYLFYNDEARAAFLADPGGILERAAHKWPEVPRSIAR